MEQRNPMTSRPLPTIRSLSIKRLSSVLGAVALMLASAYFTVLWMAAVGAISGWTGVPKYEPLIPGLQRQAGLDSSLAVTLPFVAAFLLGLGKPTWSSRDSREEPPGKMIVTYSNQSREWFASVLIYLLRLAISVLGTVGFVFLLHFLGMVWSSHL